MMCIFSRMACGEGRKKMKNMWKRALAHTTSGRRLTFDRHWCHESPLVAWKMGGAVGAQQWGDWVWCRGSGNFKGLRTARVPRQRYPDLFSARTFPGLRGRLAPVAETPVLDPETPRHGYGMTDCGGNSMRMGLLAGLMGLCAVAGCAGTRAVAACPTPGRWADTGRPAAHR